METGRPTVRSRQRAAPLTAGKRGPTLTVRIVVWAGAATVFAILALAGMLIFHEFNTVSAEATQRAGEAQAIGLAAAVGGRSEGLGSYLSTLARSEPLAQSLASDDPTAHIEAEAKLLQQLPEGSKVELYQGEQRPDPNSGYGYSGADLIRRAQAGEEPPLELHAPATNHQMLMTARPIGGTHPIGAVLFLLDTKEIASWLPKPSNNGYAELKQGEVVIAHTGDANAQQGNPYFSAVKGAIWQLSYWPAAATNEGAITLLSMVFGGALLTVTTLLLGLGWWLGRLVGEDLANFVRRTMNRKYAGHDLPLKLREFHATAVELERRRTERGRSNLSSVLHTEETPSTPPPPPSVPDPAADLVFMPKDALQVEELPPSSAPLHHSTPERR